MQNLLNIEIDRLAVLHAKMVQTPQITTWCELYQRSAHTCEDLICSLPPVRRDRWWHILNAIESVA